MFFYHHKLCPFFATPVPVPVPVPGQERVLRSLAQCGKPFAMLLPISVLHVGGEPSIQRGDLEYCTYYTTSTNNIRGMGLLYNGGWLDDSMKNSGIHRNMTEHCVVFGSFFSRWQ